MGTGTRTLAGIVLAGWWAVAPAEVTVLDFDEIDLGGNTPTPIAAHGIFDLGDFAAETLATLADFNDLAPELEEEPAGNIQLVNTGAAAKMSVDAGLSDPVYIRSFELLPFILNDAPTLSEFPPTTPRQVTVTGFNGETEANAPVQVTFLDGSNELTKEFQAPFDFLTVLLDWREPVTRLEFSVTGPESGARVLVDNLAYAPTPIPLPLPAVLVASALPLLLMRVPRASS